MVVTFSDMFKIINSGEVFKLSYYTYSKSRNEGGQKKTITARKKVKQSNHTMAPKNTTFSDPTIITVELVAGAVPTGEMRDIRPILIEKINDKTVLY